MVQKYGGTSVGKLPVKIAEEIVVPAIAKNRIAVVCSARSTSSKSEGTTNRLLRAARDLWDADSTKSMQIVEAMRQDHLDAGRSDIVVQNGEKTEAVLKQYEIDTNAVCDKLLQILESARTLEDLTPQTKDMIMSVGEKLSCLYMTAVLASRGVKATYVDMSDILDLGKTGKIPEGLYDRLAVTMGERILALPRDTVPVITGFFGKIPGGLLEEIGRGYTDLCAALVGIGLAAEELQIWKEVDGIFTADPSKVPTAVLLDSVTPSEAAELTFYGSEVIHPFTMDQVIRASIPIRIKNVKNPRGNGTVILPDPKDMQNRRPGFLFRDRSHSTFDATSPNNPIKTPKRPSAVTVKKGIAVLNIHSKKRTRAHGFLSSIFHTLDKYALSVDLISSSEVHISLALHSEARLLTGSSPEEMRIESSSLRACVDDLSTWGDIDLVPNMAIISLVGTHLRSHIGIAGRFFSTLGQHGINIEMISQGASEINISCVIEERQAHRALNVVHTNLFTFLET